MAINADFRDLLYEFNHRSVRYLVVGGYAVAFHAKPRFTKDLDIWIDPQPENARLAWEALASFGAPLQSVAPSDLAKPGMVLQIGVAPNRIDILTSLEAVEFAAAWLRRETSRYGDCDIHLLSRQDLIRNKRAVGRPQDLIDADALSSSPEEE